jgi:hypothetical protein
VEIFASHAGSTSASSFASGPLGEWFELGAIAGSAVRNERGIGSAGSAAASESRRVWVKVEALD